MKTFKKKIFFLRFKSLLACCGPDGSPNKKIEISDIKYNIFQVTNVLFIFLFSKIRHILEQKQFRCTTYNRCQVFSLTAVLTVFLNDKKRLLTSLQMMMSYLYCGGTESLKTVVPDLLEVRSTKQTQ